MFDTPHPPTTGMALLAACAEAMRAARAAHTQVLAAVAALERAEVHADCGHPSTSRLLEELLRLDRGPARALVAQSRLLVAPEPDALHPDADLPESDLPATADAASEGALDPEHVGIVAATMTRLRAVGDAGADGAELSAPLPMPVLAEVDANSPHWPANADPASWTRQPRRSRTATTPTAPHPTTPNAPPRNCA